MAYEMDDILDEWNYALLKHKIEGVRSNDPKKKVCCFFIPSSSSCLCFKKVVDRRKTGKRIENVKAALDRIFKERDEFKFEVNQLATEPPRDQSTSSIELGEIHGVDIDRNKNDIVKKLMIVNSHFEILSIVGMGGLGKTTLAKLVYNDSQVTDSFDLRVWICVSDPFDVEAIARGIVNSVTKESIPRDTDQLELILEKLRGCISGKKFLLVLDDVWTEDYTKWEPLKINLKEGASGSKIMVTTRKETVAKMMVRGNVDVEIYCPEKLSEEECWMLLRSISLSGRSEEELEGFEDVGKKIATKCDGLPLAANVLGSLLQFKNSLEEWENVLKSEIWQLEEARVDLFPHLLLSYNELSPALKRCFSYCGLYPKDFSINSKSLIEEWRALGYLGSVTGKGAVELKGQEYFNSLAMRSLFQDFGKNDYDIEWCKMHDIVHDFAQYLRKNEMTKRSCQICDSILVSQAEIYRSLLWGVESSMNHCDCFTSVRVLRFDGNLNGTPQGMEKLIHLRLLDLSNNELSGADLKTICRFYFLQTLILRSCSLKEIPREIGNLVYLRHLDLSWNIEIKELPESIFSLLELQILLLEYCSVEKIPEEIENLIQLRHLDLSRNSVLTEIPESICRLPQLQILNVGVCRNLRGLPEGMDKLQNLQHLIIDEPWVSHRLPQGVCKLSNLRTLRCGVHVGSGYNKLGLLKNLNRLTGNLALVIHLSSSDLEELVEDAREAELKNKAHIRSLDIDFMNDYHGKQWSPPSSSSSSLWMDVIEALVPNHKVNELRIKGYKGPRLPDWIRSPLNLLKEIHLNQFEEVTVLPSMGKLPFLEVLYMGGMDQLKVVGGEFLGIESSSSSSTNDVALVVVAFPKLKSLTFSYCSNWSDWQDISAEEEESAAVSVLPVLMQLRLYKCWGLKKLPHRLLRKASSLKILDITNSDNLYYYGYDKDGPAWRSISQNNPQLRVQY